MKLNCKPGDLARYVGHFQHAHGMVFLILEADPLFPGAWMVSPNFPRPPYGSGLSIWDASLRPLQNPGDDAQDETLSWLPVPTVEGTPA